jgi:hypothetical protein
VEDALARANDAGVPDTGAAEMVSTRGAGIAPLLGGEGAVRSDEAVTVVSIPGAYEDRDASVPPGAPLPTGGDIVCVYGSDGVLRDLAILTSPPDLSKLGRPQRIGQME